MLKTIIRHLTEKTIGQISFGQKVNWSNIIWPKSQLVKYHLDKSQ